MFSLTSSRRLAAASAASGGAAAAAAGGPAGLAWHPQLLPKEEELGTLLEAATFAAQHQRDVRKRIREDVLSQLLREADVVDAESWMFAAPRCRLKELS